MIDGQRQSPAAYRHAPAVGPEPALMRGAMTAPRSFYRHMTPAKAADIRRRYFAREATQAELAREYGIRQHSVSRIVSGLSWARMEVSDGR